MITPTYLLLAASFLTQAFVLAVPVPFNQSGAEVLATHTHHQGHHAGLGAHLHSQPSLSHHEGNATPEESAEISHLQRRGHHQHVQPQPPLSHHEGNVTPEESAELPHLQRRGHHAGGQHVHPQPPLPSHHETSEEGADPSQLQTRAYLTHRLYTRAGPASVPHLPMQRRPLKRTHRITPEQIHALGLPANEPSVEGKGSGSWIP